jgi:hypothetical protein
MAAGRASPSDGVARIRLGHQVEYVIVPFVVVARRAAVLVGDENDEEVGAGTHKALVRVVDCVLGNESHASCLQ